MRGLTDISQKRYSEILNENVCNFLDWSFVNAGAYITFNTNLQQQNNKNYTSGTVWQAPHSNFVWESGIQKGSPAYLSGVYINNIFSPLNSGYHVDYHNGNLIFDSPTSGTVNLTYSTKWISISDAKDVPFFARLREKAYLDNNFHKQDFSPYNTRVNLPTICVETIRRNNEPFELGGWTRTAKSDIKLHIIGERKADVERISDILIDQDDKAFWLFESNKVESSGAYPFNASGILVNPTHTYEKLIQLNQDGGYRYAKCYIREPFGEDITVLNKNTYFKTVTWKTETVLSSV